MIRKLPPDKDEGSGLPFPWCDISYHVLSPMLLRADGAGVRHDLPLHWEVFDDL